MHSPRDTLEQKIQSSSNIPNPTLNTNPEEDIPRLSYLEHLLPGSLFCNAFDRDISLVISCYATEIALCAIPNLGYLYTGSITLPILMYTGLRTLYAAAINYTSDKKSTEGIKDE